MEPKSGEAREGTGEKEIHEWWKNWKAADNFKAKMPLLQRAGGRGGKEKGIQYPLCKWKNPVGRSCLCLVTFLTRWPGSLQFTGRVVIGGKIGFYLKQPSPEKNTTKAAAGEEEIENKRVKVARSPSAATATNVYIEEIQALLLQPDSSAPWTLPRASFIFMVHLLWGQPFIHSHGAQHVHLISKPRHTGTI